MKQVYHTSPNEIKKIDPDGLFGDALFFSDDVYVMTAAPTVFVYKMKIDEDRMLDITRLFYDHEASEIQDEIDHVMAALDVDQETAESLLEDSVSTDDVGTPDPGEDGWFIEKKQAIIASLLGYDGVEMQDEQGTAYAIPMTGKLGKLGQPVKIKG